MTGLTSIIIDNELIGLKFGLQANQLYLNHLIKKSDGGKRVVVEDLTVYDIGQLIYAGYLNHCTIQDKEPIHDIEFFLSWVEDNFEESRGDILRITEVYRDSKHTKKAVERLNEKAEEIKKKTAQLTGSTSNLTVTGNSESEAIENTPT